MVNVDFCFRSIRTCQSTPSLSQRAWRESGTGASQEGNAATHTPTSLNRFIVSVRIIACSRFVLCLLFSCSRSILGLFSICFRSVLSLFSVCSWPVLGLFSVCSQPVLCLFSVCCATISQFKVIEHLLYNTQKIVMQSDVFNFCDFCKWKLSKLLKVDLSDLWSLIDRLSN